MKHAFSTVACPEWTLQRVAEFASSAGFDGVELRSFGHDSGELACEPTQIAAAKARELLEDHGLDAATVATSVRYDKPVIFPPIVGRALVDSDIPVRATKAAVQTAASLECPFVRVFAFELMAGESRKGGLRRILPRLDLAVKTARHTGVRVLLENGGSFPTAADLAEIIDAVGSPLLAAAYSPAVAAAAGEDPGTGVALLGDRLCSVKLRDLAGGRPAALGEGDLPTETVATLLRDRGYDGWLVYELDRLWLREPADPTDLLRHAAQTMTRWTARPMTEIERRKFAGQPA